FAEETKKYIGKTLHFKGMVAVDKKVPSTNVVIGRHVMTCCEADIAYRGIGMTHSGKLALETRDWVEVTGNVVLGKHPAYRGKGPVLMVTKIEKCAPPEPQLATFD
ncbi:MAG: GTPase, partial [Christensenellaceae bacterium]